MAEPLAVATSVAGVVGKADQVLKAVREGRQAETPEVIEEFRDWARHNAVYEWRAPDEEQHRDFVPAPLVRQ
ncbi:hypothetical protein ONS95_002356 [Cadophora gregata]|uniref:uncharacterized protein n=1 Tax=Cadophora gregata TaxID=51156 RepID=UPI0026DB5313|nr:uncharacterized protein ONS95_002356 [Cadophora gregata]KAK0109676.1 hypothetical protein ONS95_002356 [Cadophora gregata]